jgi:hypothetical protein
MVINSIIFNSNGEPIKNQFRVIKIDAALFDIDIIFSRISFKLHLTLSLIPVATLCSYVKSFALIPRTPGTGSFMVRQWCFGWKL